VQEKDRDCGDNAQRDEDEQRDPRPNRDAVGKRRLTGWDSHEPREPVIELHICRLIRSFVGIWTDSAFLRGSQRRAGPDHAPGGQGTRQERAELLNVKPRALERADNRAIAESAVVVLHNASNHAALARLTLWRRRAVSPLSSTTNEPATATSHPIFEPPWDGEAVARRKAAQHPKRVQAPILCLFREQPGHLCLDSYLYRDRPIRDGRHRPCSIFRYRGRRTPTLGESC